MKHFLYAVSTLILFSQVASASVAYTARCSLGAPAINIVFDKDPTTLFDCKMQNGDAYVFMKSDVHVTLGTEAYVLTGQWDSFETDCKSALALMQQGPWFPTVDTVTGNKITFVIGTNTVDVTMKTAEDTTLTCTGKIPGT